MSQSTARVDEAALLREASESISEALRLLSRAVACAYATERSQAWYDKARAFKDVARAAVRHHQDIGQPCPLEAEFDDLRDILYGEEEQSGGRDV